MASSPSLIFLNTSFLLLLLYYSTIWFHTSHPLRKPTNSNALQLSNDAIDGCNGLYRLESHEAKCDYLISKSQCNPEGYIDYLHLFYCICGKSPIFGYSILLLWLILLFYLLGNTTACYFCSNLEALSKLLKLSPAIAGVTLLSLGNGAPDVFSSIVSFMGAESTNLVGLNCVLGGAFFVSSVVVGVISICTTRRKITIDKACFIRDACFLLFVLLILLAIIVYGKINLWSAIAFSSLYLVYVFLVSVTHIFSKEEEPISHFDSNPILAEELVSLLVSFGVILNISPSILGLTVLAWGNSLSDLIANVAVAVNGGSSGVQVALSGCYGGPIFNTLAGLGISFVLFSWAGYPNSRVIPKDTTLFQTIGFLIAGLLWALVILPRRGMKLDRVLGAGLICIYLCFLSVSKAWTVNAFTIV